jgi:hypothetical protein
VHEAVAWLGGTRTYRRIDEVLEMPSGMWGRGAGTVREALEHAVERGRDPDTDFHRALTAEMRSDGINCVPLLVAPACILTVLPWLWTRPGIADSTLVLASGHRRLMIAIELGWHRVLTTNCFSDTQVQLYEQFWRQRGRGAAGEGPG